MVIELETEFCTEHYVNTGETVRHLAGWWILRLFSIENVHNCVELESIH